ncbi:MAG: ABC transporter substrate-binding protein [Phycisphaerales bacterium JB065]
MQSKFGLKDFILYVLVFCLAITVVFAMKQNDRNFKRLSMLEEATKRLELTEGQTRDEVTKIGEELINELSESLRAEVLILKSQIDRLGESGSGLSVTEGQTIDEEGRDLSWARPGVPVTFPEPYSYVNDPSDRADYAVGGEFIETFEAQFPKITPYFYSDVYGRRIVDESVCEQLGRYDPQSLEWVGLLAEAWQIDPDGMWLRAKINPRARFSDGVPVTAEDFRWTFHDLVFNPQHETERFRSTLNVIEEVKVISERVVEFRFTTANFTNVSQALSLTVVPKHFYEQFQPSQLNQATGLLLGSGPYRLETLDPKNQWTQGTDLVLVRNENYWGRKPAISRLRFNAITDNVARLTTFENGDAHMIRGTSDQYRSKTNDQNFMAKNRAEQWINMRSGFGFIAWNCGNRNGEATPFTDARVRRAMTHLLDRERILRDFANGLGAVATGPFPPAGPMNNPEITPRPYDLEAAKRLLDEAGWLLREDGYRYKDGKRFEFEYTISQGSSYAEKVAGYLTVQCAQVGIICSTRKIDWAIFAETLDNRDFDAITMQWSQSAPESDPYQLWHSNSIKNRGDNFAQWSNPRADELIMRGRQTLDNEERMKIWHELHEVFYEEQPYTFLLNTPWIRFISRDVENVHTYPIGLDRNEMYFPAAF